MIFNKIDPKSRKFYKNQYFYIKSLTSIPFRGPIGKNGEVQPVKFSRSWTPLPTNRPPKGDRSEGFYIKISILIDFSRFWADFIKNHIFIYGD